MAVTVRMAHTHADGPRASLALAPRWNETERGHHHPEGTHAEAVLEPPAVRACGRLGAARRESCVRKPRRSMHSSKPCDKQRQAIDRNRQESSMQTAGCARRAWGIFIAHEADSGR